MPSPLQEYRRRVRSDFIPALEEGVVFFEKPREGACVACTTSGPGKVAKTCQKCVRQLEPIVAEFYSLDGRGGCLGALLGHHHIEADDDVSRLARSVYGGVVPFAARSEDEVEAYLWRCYNGQRGRRDGEFSMEEFFEEMFHEATGNRGSIDAYVKFVWQKLLMGRRYLLLEP